MSLSSNTTGVPTSGFQGTGSGMHLKFQRTTCRLGSLKTASIAGRIPPD